MDTKSITMMMREGNTSVTISETYDGAASWGALAYQFLKFLRAQGYILDEEAVGADVADYTAALSEEEQY
jgi:hypothetical protein